MKRKILLAAGFLFAWTVQAATPPFLHLCQVAPEPIAVAKTDCIGEWEAEIADQLSAWTSEQMCNGKLKGVHRQTFLKPDDQKKYVFKVTWELLEDGSSLSCVSWEAAE